MIRRSFASIKKRYFWLIRSDKDEIKHILEKYEEERKAKLMAYDEANEHNNEEESEDNDE